MFKQFSIGLRSYSEAAKFIRQHKLGKFFLVPLVLYAILFALNLTLAGSLSDFVFEKLKTLLLQINPNTWYGKNIALVWHKTGTVLSFLIQLTLKMAVFFITAIFGGYLALIFLSPFYAYLSEKVGQILMKKEYPFNLKKMMFDVLRGIAVAGKNFLLQIAITLLLFALSFVPILGLICPLIVFVVSCYFYGYSFMDYSFERDGIKLSKSHQIINRNKGLAIGIGFLFNLSLFIPFVGNYIAGMLSIYTIIGASLKTQQLIDAGKI